MPDWKKEIRISDLFKRKPKGSTDATDLAASPSAPAPHATDASTPQQPESGTASAAVPQPIAGPPAPPTEQAAGPPAPPTESASAAAAAGPAPADVSQSEPSATPSDPAWPSASPAPPGAPVPGHPVEPAPAEPARIDAPHTEPPAAQTPPPAHAQVSGTPSQPVTTAGAGEGAQEESAWKREVHASDLLKKMGWSGGSKGPRGKALDQGGPRPQSPQPDSPAQGGEDVSRWKRELRAGDLFRRREQAPPVPGDVFSEQGSEPVSFWKKELSLSDLLRTTGEDSGTATVDAPEQTPTSTPATGKEAKKSKSRGLPKLDLKLGRGSFGPKRGSGGGAAATPIAVPLTRAVNLLPPDLVAQRTRRFGRVELAVAVAAVVVIAGLVVVFMSASSRVTEAQDQVVVLEQQQADLEQAAIAAAAGAGLQADPLLGEELSRATALSGALGSRTVWDRILRQVTVVMPPDIWLRGLSGTSTTSDVVVPIGAGAEFVSTLTLTGYALNREGVAQMLSRMDTVPELANVQLLAATVTELSGEEVVEFSITATLKESVQIDQVPTPTPIGVTP